MAEYLGRHVVDLDLEQFEDPPGGLDWHGPFDVENPRNWSISRKVRVTFVPALYGFAV